MTPCPCNSTLPYANCCAPFHQGQAAPSARQLMRSRYSAFVLGLGEYLVQSWHPDYLGDLTAAELSRQQTRWAGLEILATQGGEASDEEGEVEFKAWFAEQGQHHCLHERSRFVRLAGRWVYTDGEQFAVDPRPLPGRNDPCPCGSGKKFKKCCG
ncbi:YchJ family protein [Aeromonas bivalvium]|uniref:YchJ family protein n=1 Tax=Aeromonas bivalvium TaxID=440079 RepID=UPI0038D088C0